MASSPSESSPPSLEELSTRGATALLLPWIFGMASATDFSPREVAVFVHQPTRSITLVEGSLDIESLIPEITSKEDPLPASKASIESLPRVRISELDWECAICLAENEVKDGEVEVKEMPCRHKFHSDCIDKWLGIRGSCPVCRYGLPVEEKKDVRDGWRIHVFFARGRTDSESDMDVDTDRADDQEMESPHDSDDELPAQDAE